ncbi:MAG: medium chain dehydrogenase/reductase family protein [Solirubrobacterales bacterium]
MRAVVLTGTGGPEVLQVQERPDPVPGPGEVRVAVRAAGINFADTMARVGVYPDAPKSPCVLGYEIAGEIDAVGEGVADREEGERVMGATRFGGQAELVTLPAEHTLTLPAALSFEQGAAFPVNYGTAYAALNLMGGMRAGERVLVHAAAGGVGIAATQLARNAGTEVFGTASAAKHEAIRAQGVDHPIDYRNQDFEAEVRRLTGGGGIDLAIDALGPSSFRKDYRLLRPGGRLVMFGLSEVTRGGARDIPATLKSLAKMPLATMPWWRSLALMNENKGIFGLNLLAWWDEEGSLDRVTEPLVGELEAGRLEPVVAASFPFERAGEAHLFIGERRNVGKVVLLP